MKAPLSRAHLGGRHVAKNLSRIYFYVSLYVELILCAGAENEPKRMEDRQKISRGLSLRDNGGFGFVFVSEKIFL
jgi:hypothetical protein